MTRLRRERAIWRGGALVGAAVMISATSEAQPSPVTWVETEASAATATTPAAGGPKVSFSGYIEAFYQWNFNRPGNDVTAYRGFDTRHNSFTLSNAVLDASFSRGAVSGRLALQAGHTPETYYLSEPRSDGGGSTGTTGKEVWKFLQQANVGYRPAEGWQLEAGLFLSPIGVEGMAIKDNYSWSRSNLFYGLPFYHTGARATYALSERWSLTAAVYNGWNSVVDNNREKSVSGSLVYTAPDRLTVSLLYFGGVERARGAPEGRAWRHMLDAYVTAQASERVKFYVHGNAGLEPNEFGKSWWGAGGAAAQVRLVAFLYGALRADYFREQVGSNARGAASPIFWPAEWVGSGTATLDARPADGLSIRLEYRHDEAGGPTFFKGALSGETPAPNSDHQNTLTLGAVAWFLAIFSARLSAKADMRLIAKCNDAPTRGHARTHDVGWFSCKIRGRGVAGMVAAEGAASRGIHRD